MQSIIVKLPFYYKSKHLANEISNLVEPFSFGYFGGFINAILVIVHVFECVERCQTDGCLEQNDNSIVNKTMESSIKESDQCDCDIIDSDYGLSDSDGEWERMVKKKLAMQARKPSRPVVISSKSICWKLTF